MEGVTTWIYRAAYHRHFAPAVRYFTPFIAPNMNKGLNTRERNDVLPEHNEGQALIPQILTNRADYFLTTCRDLAELGYDEVNLNLGCPSGTVVSKGKGSGFLAHPDELDAFFDQVFAKKPLPVSVKTRLGYETPEEFAARGGVAPPAGALSEVPLHRTHHPSPDPEGFLPGYAPYGDL